MRFVFFIIFLFSNASLYAQANNGYQLETIADGINHPWSIAFLPDGDYLLSLHGGELRRLSSAGELGDPVQNTPATYAKSQGGYLDVVLDPQYAQNRTIYLAYAHGTPSANATRVIKATLSENSLENIQVIFTVQDKKDTPVHYGGRLLFINDGTLLLTTGDGFDYREAAQDRFSQLGKIIRIKRNGEVPSSNPFVNSNGDSAIYTYGHRNPQGLAYDSSNNIVYMHEHGPQGGDEINIVDAGSNYGWPATSYGDNYSGAYVSPLKQAPGVTDPIHYWTPSVAPSGLAFYNADAFPKWKNSLFVGTLVNKDVRRLQIDNQKIIKEEVLFSEIKERIRDVRVGPDGYLYLLTGSQQGSVIRVKPE